MAPRSHLEQEINAPISPGLRTPRRIVSGALLCVLAALTVAAATPARGAPAAVAAGTIVFASERSGSSQIYSIHADGSRLGQLTRNRYGDSAPVFSPDGRRIVFARSTRCCSGLWLMNADGSGQRPLAAYASDPAWSPNSRRSPTSPAAAESHRGSRSRASSDGTESSSAAGPAIPRGRLTGAGSRSTA